MENNKPSDQKSTLLVGVAIVGSLYLLLSSVFLGPSSSSQQVVTYRGNLLASVEQSISTNYVRIDQTIRSSGTKADPILYLPAWTPNPNDLILVTIATRDISDIPYQVQGNGIAFERILTKIDDQESQRISIYRGMSSGSTPGVITFSWNETSTDRGWSATATRFSGIDTSGTNGSGAIDSVISNSVGKEDTNFPSAQITTLSNNVLVYAAQTNRNRTTTFTDNWIPLVQALKGGDSGSNITLDTAYKMFSVPGIVSFNTQLTTNPSDWTVGLVAIKSGTSNTTPPPSPVPAIVNLSPSSGPVGTEVELTVTNFTIGGISFVGSTNRVPGSSPDSVSPINGEVHFSNVSPTSGKLKFTIPAKMSPVTSESGATIQNTVVPGNYYFGLDTDNSRSEVVYFKVTENSSNPTPVPPPTPAPTPVPTNATVSSWSSWTAITEWSACINSKQERTEQRTRTIITPATNGGTTPSLSETRTRTQTCNVPVTPTPPTPSPTPTPNPTPNPTPTPVPPTPPANPLPTLNFNASPILINSGQSSTLSWTSTNSVSCTATGGWTGDKPVQGTGSNQVTVTPSSETTYSLTCRNSAGNTITKTLTIAIHSLPLSHQERLDKSRAEFASDPRLNCSKYPEKRIFVETQAWWMKLDTVKFPSSIPSNQLPEAPGKGGHGHTATCFPIEQKIDSNGIMHFDVRLMLHKGNESKVEWLDIGLGPGGSSKARVTFNPPLTCAGGDNVDVNCTYWVPIDLDLSKIPAGYQELRFRFNMIHPSGDRQYATTGWNAYYHGGTGGFRTPPWQEARGWWPTTSYTRSRLFSKLPMEPVSGNITLNIEGSNATQTGLHIDGFFNMNDFGEIVFETQKSFKGPLTIDTTKLSNGMHWVAILSSKAAGAGTNTTIFQFPIIVNN